MTSFACRYGVNPPVPSSLLSLSTSFFPNPTTQQDYIDFYYRTIDATWPSSDNVVIGYWAPMVSWIDKGASVSYPNLNDWFHWTSTPIVVTPSQTGTPTACLPPTDATCKNIVKGCLTGPAWNTDPRVIKIGYDFFFQFYISRD